MATTDRSRAFETDAEIETTLRSKPKLEAEQDLGAVDEDGFTQDPNVYGLRDETLQAIREGRQGIDYGEKHPLAGKCTCIEAAGEIVREAGRPDRVVNNQNGSRVRIPDPNCPVGNHGPY